jgi:hypothetical protein
MAVGATAASARRRVMEFVENLILIVDVKKQSSNIMRSRMCGEYTTSTLKKWGKKTLLEFRPVSLSCTSNFCPPPCQESMA